MISQSTKPSSTCIPQTPRLDPFTLDSAIPLIISQSGKISQFMVFKMCFHIEDGLRWRAGHSNITRWSMYLGARVLEAISNSSDGQRDVGWVTRFHQRIVEDSASTKLTLVDSDAQLAGLHDLTTLMSLTSGTPAGYSLFKRYFVAKLMRFESLLSMIQLSRWLSAFPHSYYDTATSWVDEGPKPYLEWVCGVPARIIAQIAKINSWRTLRLMGQATSNEPDWREIEAHVQRWSPSVEHTEEPNGVITRLAIQESWHQGVLIYLCGCQVNSADPRVESAAGAAARSEKHRAILRRKLATPRNEIALLLGLRVTDFTAALDRLWHTTASGGRPVTWEDYIQARYVALPVAL
ncbi:Fungal-specific transcription factor domain containing protein [Ceratobasidium theobromae]|uniref:Fungal-specific transcription factor domain containing protein n=1 Tax=Ceratobasidium theobromae TaxID=1582974 RepID=A0A5N5QBH7_9AGAM|nr:Fungal-specific transcription factor domain containing protein [Ceratobasidium theobromae]